MPKGIRDWGSGIRPYRYRLAHQSYHVRRLGSSRQQLSHIVRALPHPCSLKPLHRKCDMPPQEPSRCAWVGHLRPSALCAGLHHRTVGSGLLPRKTDPGEIAVINCRRRSSHSGVIVHCTAPTHEVCFAAWVPTPVLPRLPGRGATVRVHTARLGENGRDNDQLASTCHRDYGE